MQKYICSILFLFAILLGCESDRDPATPKEPKLDYYLESFDISELGFQPQTKVVYAYSESGKLSKYTVSTYHPDSKSFVELRNFEFVYSDNQVTKIVGYLAGATEPHVAYSYSYLPDGRVSRIEETRVRGINSEAGFVYDETNQSTKVSYFFSNGGSFEYEFHTSGGNIVTDKTTRGSQVCSDGVYAYDNHVNPFKNLGYVDYVLTNLSDNNRTSENINHLSCAFPSFIPESYVYEYNDRGYPTLMTTFYKSNTARSQREIFYK